MEQIEKQFEDLTKQSEIYREETEKKKTEELELLKVLKEYKSKYQEFEKATKKSSAAQNQLEKEKRALDTRRKTLETQLAKSLKEVGLKQVEDGASDIAALEANWAAEKERLTKQRDDFKAECATL